jgi:hypothetical protein
MAELVAAYPVGAFTDPQNGNSPIDADEVRANDDALRSGSMRTTPIRRSTFRAPCSPRGQAAGTRGPQVVRERHEAGLPRQRLVLG